MVNYWDTIEIKIKCQGRYVSGIYNETIRIIPANNQFVGAEWMPYTPIWQGGHFEAAQPLLVLNGSDTAMRIPQYEKFLVEVCVV